MKIVNEYPPNYDKIKDVFAVDESAQVVFCYGETVYNPYRLPLRDDLIHHEAVHAKQQDEQIDEWWQKYIDDPLFRVSQELEAYGQQVKFIRQRQGELRAIRAAVSFSKYLASPVYGSAITSPEALKRMLKVSRRK